MYAVEPVDIATEGCIVSVSVLLLFGRLLLFNSVAVSNVPSIRRVAVSDVEVSTPSVSDYPVVICQHLLVSIKDR